MAGDDLTPGPNSLLTGKYKGIHEILPLKSASLFSEFHILVGKPLQDENRAGN
jgi:hypothetical protein